VTPFSDVYDLALMLIQDYTLNNLYQISPTDFETFMQGLLIRAIPDFKNCEQDLSNYDENAGTFNITLTYVEKDILAKLLTIKWWVRGIQDIRQTNLHLNDNDFKHFSEAQNLAGKQNYREVLREEVDRDMTEYGLKNINWTEWANGKFA
jgi:hypothetical protein